MEDVKSSHSHFLEGFWWQDVTAQWKIENPARYVPHVSMKTEGAVGFRRNPRADSGHDNGCQATVDSQRAPPASSLTPADLTYSLSLPPSTSVPVLLVHNSLE